MGTGTKRYPKKRATSTTGRMVGLGDLPLLSIDRHRSETPVAVAIVGSDTPGCVSLNCRNSSGDILHFLIRQCFANATGNTFPLASATIHRMAQTDVDPLLRVVAANVRAARERAGLTRAQLAARAGFSERTIGYVEAPEHRTRGARRDPSPTISSILRIAEALHLPPWQLLLPDFDPGERPVVLPERQASEEAELMRLYRAMHPDTRPALVARARRLQEVDGADVATEPRPSPAPTRDGQRRGTLPPTP